MSSEITINVGNFKTEVLESDIPVLVDFWAPWCMPCKMIAPFLEQIAEKYSGELKVGKINIDDEEKLAEEHSIFSIPTLVLFKDGEIVERREGAIPRHDIEVLIKNNI